METFGVSNQNPFTEQNPKRKHQTYCKSKTDGSILRIWIQCMRFQIYYEKGFWVRDRTSVTTKMLEMRKEGENWNPPN